jgi:hypothetical protein
MPLFLKAGEEKEIIFKYDAVKRGEIGAFKDVVTFKTQDTVEPILTIIIESVINENFSKLTPKQLQDAPKVHLDSIAIDFGKISKNTNPTKQISLYNKGKNPLIIRQLKSSNSVFSVVSDKNEISKDSFSTLTITFNSRNRRGPQTSVIEIITNDPAHSRLLLNCKGDVLQ